MKSTTLLVLLVLLATTALATATASSTTTSTSSITPITSSGLQQSLGCDACQLVIAAANVTISSNATMDELAKYLDSKCSSLGFLSSICDSVVKSLVNALHGLPDKLAFLGYTSPLDACAFLGACTSPCCLTNTIPEQVHLAYGAQANSMIVSWLTLQTTATSTIQFGTTSDSLTQTITGNYQTYTEGGFVGYIHHVEVNNLLPQTKYYYRVGDEQAGYSPVHSFINKVPTRFAIIGDMGARVNSDKNVAWVTALAQNDKIDAVLHVGDESYANGIQRIWGDFLRKIEPIASHVPYMLVPGNHEVPWNFSAYKNHFFMPMGTQDPADRNMFWTLDFGPIHVVAMNTESSLDTPQFDSVQATWAAQQLANSSKKFKVVMFHRPIYCSSTDAAASDCGADMLYLRGLLEPMLANNKVDLVFTAHVHNYERTHPVYANTTTDLPKTGNDYVNPSHPLYVINGAGGNIEQADRVNTVGLPDWSASRYGNWGYGILELEDENTLSFGFYESTDNALIDSFRIIKN